MTFTRLFYFEYVTVAGFNWEEVFKNGSSKICGRQPLKNLKGYGQPKADHTPSIFLKVVFHKFYLVRS